MGRKVRKMNEQLIEKKLKKESFILYREEDFSEEEISFFHDFGCEGKSSRVGSYLKCDKCENKLYIKGC